jgi:hypothetical protein
MNLDEFTASTTGERAPTGLPTSLLAMWYDAKNDWAQAHQAIQDDNSVDGSWIHAYLHRVEGDQSNAAYWYRRAGRPTATTSLEDEWRQIVAELLDKYNER